MTTGEFDPYKLNPDLVSKALPDEPKVDSFLPPEITERTPEDEERIAEMIREGQIILGVEMLDLLTPQPWGSADIEVSIEPTSPRSGENEIIRDRLPDIELGNEQYFIKSDMSVADVTAAIERIVRPRYDATAVREGYRPAHYDLGLDNLEQGNHLPATPQQAATMLSEVVALTALRGKNYGDRNTFGAPLDVVPAAVAEHLPTPDPASDVSHSAYVVQIFDRETGLSKNEGVVGMITITQHEKPVPGVIYAAHANYHITTDNGGETYGLERHVTNTEHGPHMVGSSDRVSLADMRTELARVQRERPIEKAMGLLTVTEAEALQLIDLVARLKNESGS